MISSSMLFPMLVIAFIFVVSFVSEATLPEDEVEALHVIARSLGKSDWNFSVDPCSGLSGWATRNADPWFENAVTCDCTFNNYTVCHVIGIILESQSLNGSVPRELVRLPFLQEIDLSGNYLNGSIPREWGSMNLVNIYLSGNRLSGPIPRELANISTLTNLTLEYNQLSGTVPSELGNLPRIELLILESNNFSGELPKSLARLRTLRWFSIRDNNFSGSIPNFIQNWTSIESLLIQASGLTGPIPSGITSLTTLKDLKISDLSGNESSFPPLSNLKRLETLILRSCNIVGELPPYIGELTGLTHLDLSFNKLSGPIPSSFSGLSDTDYIYLTGNSLSGQLPAWMQAGDAIIDLSYNNLTSGNSVSSCQQRNLNLFASSKGNTSGIVSCLGISRCEKLSYSLRINCGGRRTVDDRGNVYEEDAISGGPSDFVKSTPNWGFSSTGDFMYNDGTDSYILTNRSSVAGENSQLYMDARLSPLSLTYYGFCMINGSYRVNLHFAEIMFTNDRTYNSLGRRIFDVYIQGKLVLKDFNIADEAGGVNMAITKNFPAVVTDNTLDIRFYWAGKGTTHIPANGVYGPLISAISADSDKKPPSSDITLPSENGNSISAGAIIGIVLGVLFTILLVLVILWWKGCLKRERTLEDDLKGVDLNTGLFTLRHIKAATNNFDPANKIGEGGFGPVFKGLLSDGKMMAVKQLSSKSKQGNREFVNEIGMISALQHPNLVKLYGCCIEGNQLLLIYEYLENNSLARALFGPEEHQLQLDWPTRHKICVGIARGLAYLHEESRLKIVHRDIKATNVLLDKNLFPKISDFGLAKLDEEDNSHISTRVAGTLGYMAPEYAMRGHLTDKADVYSFGVVLLEVVSGRSNITVMTKESLLDLAKSLMEEGNLIELVDPRLGSNFNEEEVLTTIKVGLLCTNLVAAERPSMSAVVSMLEGRAVIREFVSKSRVPVDKMSKNDALQQQIVARDVPLTASSASTTGDLYPITVDTVYWEKWDP